jgi:hypothetical protein
MMNATASIAPAPRRATRFGLASLLLLGVVLAAGWLLFNGAAQWTDVHPVIKIDGETIDLGDGDPLQWLVAGIGLLIAAVVVLLVMVLVVPLVLVFALAVPVLVVLVVLAVPLLLAALLLSPMLLLLWLLWKLIA